MSIAAPTAIQSFDTIDLGRHGLIEASAGTGKTFTIENLVIRILKEIPDLSIDNILLVTYTEKAASELKARIRLKIINELETPLPKSISRTLRMALHEFDSASIQTIHGFCHTLLNDFAFENGTLFQTELIDDRLLYERALKKQMRAVWPVKYDHFLPMLLAISGFNRQPTAFEQQVIALAGGRYRPEGGDRLHPDPTQTSTFSLIDAFKQAQKDLGALIGPQSGFVEGYQQLNFNARSKKSLLERVIIPLVEWLNNRLTGDPDLIGFGEIYEVINTSQKFKAEGPVAIVPKKYNGGKDNSKKACPNLSEAVAAFTQIIMVFEKLRQILAAETVLSLQKEVKNNKQMQGAITYDDMLTHVLAALTAPGANRLLTRLHKRYRFAFVDEFQDTDPIQWRIFKKIFLDDSPCRLFLIGDPKQAIYGFRGADVITYLSARSFFDNLRRKKKAQLYTLGINYRSIPSLVLSYNRLFSEPSWFGSTDQTTWNEITYAPVGTPQGQPLSLTLAKDNSKRAALNIIDLRGPTAPITALMKLSRFISDEITYLLTEKRIGIESGNNTGDSRPLDAGDIAILVRSRTNVELIETALAEKNIPYSFYRRPGLFDSDEAWYLSIVLNAVNNPSDPVLIKKALLTPFFNWSSKDLLQFEDLPASHPGRKLFFSWHDLAKRRRWGALFQSIITESGLVYRQSTINGWDRMEANFNQIIAYLNDAAYRKNLDSTEICAHLDALRRHTTGVGESGDIHEIETEHKKVQILTMHRSKGLEFPVVFVAGGLTRGIKNDYHQFHQINGNQPFKAEKIIDLTCRAAPSSHHREIEDEDKRLLYVALTRARFKLYLPFFPAPSKRAYFGPLCQFVAQSIKSAFGSLPPKREKTAWLKTDDHESVFKNQLGGEHPQTSPPIRLNRSATDRLPEEKSYTQRAITVESFSSIHAKQSKQTSSPSHPFFDADIYLKAPFHKEDDERIELTPPAEAGIHQTADDIPGGTEVGLMFHNILETIDFSAVIQNPQALFNDTTEAALIDRQLLLYQIDPVFRNEIAKVIINTLIAPVAPISRAFRLGDLPHSDRIHEVPFYYSMHSTNNRFVQGVIDLVFRYEGKYYLADWKSNRLATGYHQKAMAESMDTADYHLQYRLYTVALLRWLKQSLGNQFHLKTHFGGIFYFFLRGMGSKEDDGTYFIPPETIGALDSLEASVTTQITF